MSTSINLVKQLQQRKQAEKRSASGPNATSAAMQNFVQRFRELAQSRIELTGPEKVRLGLMCLGLLSIAGTWFAVGEFTSRLQDEKQQELTVLDQQVAAEKKKLAQFSGTQGEIESYERKMELMRKKLSLIEGVRNNRNAIVRMVDFVVSEMPASVWLTKITIGKESAGAAAAGDQSVSITGYAVSLQLVSEFMKRLEGAIFFPKWTLVETVKESVQNDRAGSNPPATLFSSSVRKVIPSEAKRFEIKAKVVTP